MGKKPALMCSDAFRRAFGAMSKAALIDALWCACQLGTDESAEQIEAQAARNAQYALVDRHDRVPQSIAEFAERRIDSDPYQTTEEIAQ
jgi:hypothetical protein